MGGLTRAKAPIDDSMGDHARHVIPQKHTDTAWTHEMMYGGTRWVGGMAVGEHEKLSSMSESYLVALVLS